MEDADLKYCFVEHVLQNRVHTGEEHRILKILPHRMRFIPQFEGLRYSEIVHPVISGVPEQPIAAHFSVQQEKPKLAGRICCHQNMRIRTNHNDQLEYLIAGFMLA